MRTLPDSEPDPVETPLQFTKTVRTLGKMLEQVNFGYSMKKTYIPRNREYLMQLTHSVQECVNNLRWRAEHYLRPKHVKNKKVRFGFKSIKSAEPIAEMKDFEDKLFELTKNIKFEEVHNSFQNKLNKDIRDIQNDPRVYCPADKTTNFYKMKIETAEALVEKEIHKEYKKAKPDIVEKLNDEGKSIAMKLELEDRVFATSKQEAFQTLKDHKENFKNNPTSRLG